MRAKPLEILPKMRNYPQVFVRRGILRFIMEKILTLAG